MTAPSRLLGGRYQVGELLGYGGMAEVHRGRDLRLGRDVAIKMLRTDLARDATFQERFRREAQNSAALNHPAIVAVYDTGEEISAAGEKQPFIVMEFVPGKTLKEVLAAEQRLQPRRALEILADIDAALEFSHRHGIIHRDIKPGNVMITPNGQVKVMDFGIARALASGATTMTQTSAVIGTAQYLSPEQARGESVDARSDVYAAGCVLFELIVGHPPFVGDSPVSVAYQHVREQPKAPSDIVHDLPPEIDAIVLKALAKNPLNRYQSAQEMRADALRAVAGRPVMAPAVMTEAETMAMTGGMGGAPTAMTRPIQAGYGPQRGGPQQPQRKTSSWVMAALAALGVLAVVALGIGLALAGGNDDNNDAPVTKAIPKVTGLSEGDAKTALTQAGFTNVSVGDSIPKQDCKETVERQTPVESTAVPLDQQITIQVCSPPEQIRVPSGLKGSTQSVAVEAIESKGLKTDIAEKDSSSASGTVIDVEKEGENVDPGTTITITVSRGNLVAIPDVKGQTEDSAKAVLKSFGFTNVTTEESNEDGTPGTVVSQSPSANSKKSKSTKIVLTVIAEKEPEPSDPPSSDPGASSPPPDDGTGGGEGTVDDLLN
ncbi:Stk1 family PASTA domain-containing Ser/Thr kinase [Winogradskya humida]|uniref:non-specific serine/threonine protein kinase n=1 Tax=Winogradskya humida TaxID=113566 RepID=A0ABQ3ZN71_9ACTN|nr:Stk1 family PASTA domain-containing Ser/Thr kinase [Actinoplanes humidus]GIE20034.1 putative serine/threonine-protein kinase [Actinoplanes humidus]